VSGYTNSFLIGLIVVSSLCELALPSSISTYVGSIDGKQEVMVGYSDSAKDAGRLAACWAQYTAQEAMASIASNYGIELTFFHGKGGTVGRGGNPALYRAILSHPPNTINGRFRVTEQGEMIRQNFGTKEISERVSTELCIS
jgi:phosphoenolpyruvate carboxylase